MTKYNSKWMSHKQCLSALKFFNNHEKNGLIKIHLFEVSDAKNDVHFREVQTGKNKGKLIDCSQHQFTIEYDTVK